MESAGRVNDPLLEEIGKQIDEAESHLSVTPTQSILFTGITGSGKSTLVNYLSGEGTQSAEYSRRTDGMIIKGGRLRTGDQITSITSIPEFYRDNNGVYYWDCQGFNDNRSQLQEIVNSYCLKYICGISTECKIVLVLNSSIFNRANNIENFYELCLQIQMSVPDLVRLSKSLVVVITSCSQYTTMSDVTEDLEEVRRTNGFRPALSSFFDMLISKSRAGKIGIFPRPSQPGLIDQSYKSSIMQLIRSAEFMPFEWAPIVGNSCRVYVNELLKNVRNDIKIGFLRNIEKLMNCSDANLLTATVARMNAIMGSEVATAQDYRNLFDADMNFIAKKFQRAQILQDTIDPTVAFDLSQLYGDISGFCDKLLQRINYLVQQRQIVETEALRSSCFEMQQSIKDLKKQNEELMRSNRRGWFTRLISRIF